MADTRLTTSYWPAEAGEIRPVTVGEVLYDAVASVPDRVALVDCVEDPALRRQWTYREFVDGAEKVARALLARFSPGDRVAIWAPNSAEWVFLQQGISLAGMVMVALNPAYRAREVRFVLEQSQAKGLFFTASYRGFDMAGMVQEILPSLPGLRETVSLDEWDAFLASGDAATDLPATTADDMIQVQYTSGTTGFPKGAMLHHKGLVNEARFVAERAGMGPGGICVNAMPMYHIGGGAVTSFGVWVQKGTFVLLPHFEPGLLLEALETYRGEHTLVVPTMLIALLDHPDRDKRDLSSVQTIWSGAASVSASLVRRTMSLLDCQFTILFGQTEAHGVISQTRITDSSEDQANTVGQPLPQLEVKIADALTGEPTPLGTPGEICFRGYQTMLGYYRMPEETGSTIDSDGWLHMGDIGVMDDRGYLRVTGRVRDLIIRGGMNVYPAEIEGALQDHPAIETAVVIGVPDEKWGEQIAAVLRVRAGVEKPTVQDLTDFMRGQLSSHKTPTFWTFVDELPMTPTGKIQKFVLRDRAAQGELELLERSAPAGVGAVNSPQAEEITISEPNS
ncbi:MAG: AMP-dependent synthetase [Frankiales bacterium]|jgi:fatty-acyl-CoA synthase|nr:AMP-dependent synthetase [Frankiales bacterium]